MKIIPIGKPEIVMQNPDSRHNYFAWPTVARLQNGKIAVTASGFRMDHLCPFGKAVIAFSEDEGKTYTLPTPVIDTPLDDRDSGILPFGESSVIVTSFNHPRAPYRKWAKGWAPELGAEEYVNKYLDLVTDEDEEKYLGSTFRISNDCGVTFGPIMRCPVSSPHGPCELSDGSVLWVGRLKNDAAANADENPIKACKIHPDGTWEIIGAIDGISYNGEKQGVWEPHAIQLKDGRIICHIRVQTMNKSSVDGDLFTVYQSISEDGGRIWTKPVQILGNKDGSPAHLIEHSSGMLISLYGRRITPYGIKAMFSKDGGKTWDINNDIYVNELTTDIGYPATIEMSDGSLLSVFYARPTADYPSVVIMQQRWRFEEE